jgi:hypothetical protein
VSAALRFDSKGRFSTRFSGHLPGWCRGPQRCHRGDSQLVCEPQSTGHPLAVCSGRARRLFDVHPQIPGSVDDARRCRDGEFTNRAHRRRHDVLDEPRRASARRLGHGQKRVRANQCGPDQLDHVQRPPCCLAHDAACEDQVLEAPFLHGITILEAPLSRPHTAIAWTSSEVYIPNK